MFRPLITNITFGFILLLSACSNESQQNMNERVDAAQEKVEAVQNNAA